LSDPDPAARVGSLLPDLVPMNALASLPEGLQRGVAQHQRIDAFTDAHPIARQSISRFAPPFRRFGGILTGSILASQAAS
jgi:acyl carrier protein phosphodiesterase